MSDEEDRSKKKSKQVCGRASNPACLTETQRQRLKSKREGKMRENKGEYVRISHSQQAEKTPNFLSLTEKWGKKQDVGEKTDGELQKYRNV